MNDLFLIFQNLVATRLHSCGSFTSFGEDSIRYDFYTALMRQYGLDPHQIILEQPIPPSQFEQRQRLGIGGRGRHEDKPEFDLRVDPTNELPYGILAEFAYFRKPQNATLDVSGAYGKILNEMHRLALLKHYRNLEPTYGYADFSDYKCLLICVTDSVMLDYGNGTRGRKPAHNILDVFQLDQEFLSPPLANVIIESIEPRFANKARTLNIVPTGNRIYNAQNHLGNQKWSIWIWEVDYL